MQFFLLYKKTCEKSHLLSLLCTSLIILRTFLNIQETVMLLTLVRTHTLTQTHSQNTQQINQFSQ